jgi:hypothetical protein
LPCVPDFLFLFYIGRIDGEVHVLKHYSVGAVFFRFVCMELYISRPRLW